MGCRAEAPPGYPNPWVELAVRAHLPAGGAQGAAAGSRNHLNVLSADRLVALPGGEGNRSELELVRRYGCPMALLGSDGPGEWGLPFPSLEPLLAWLDGAGPEGRAGR